MTEQIDVRWIDTAEEKFVVYRSPGEFILRKSRKRFGDVSDDSYLLSIAFVTLNI